MSSPPKPARSQPKAIPEDRPRMRRTQEQRREESEQRLLDAALTLVAEKGPARVTLAEIGERAGYSRGLPAHRFGSKAKLLAALAQHINDRFAQHRRAYPGARGLGKIEAVIRAYFTRNDPNWTTTRALIVLMAEGALCEPELQPILAEYNRDLHSYLAHHIEVAQQAGEARADVDAQMLAVVLLSVFRGAMLQRLNDPGIPIDRVRDEVLAMVRERLVVKK
jgi:AcrR family transcriptional regulator